MENSNCIFDIYGASQPSGSVVVSWNFGQQKLVTFQCNQVRWAIQKNDPEPDPIARYRVAWPYTSFGKMMRIGHRTMAAFRNGNVGSSSSLANVYDRIKIFASAQHVN